MKNYKSLGCLTCKIFALLVLYHGHQNLQIYGCRFFLLSYISIQINHHKVFDNIPVDYIIKNVNQVYKILENCDNINSHHFQHLKNTCYTFLVNAIVFR